MPCASCNGAATQCTSCLGNFLLYNATLANSTCLFECPTDTIQAGSLCVPCSASCATCVSSPSTCTSCSDASALLTPDGQCVSSCPSGTTADYAASTCDACQSPCADCSGTITTCTSCVDGGYALNGVCYSACPSGYVGEVVGGIATCLGCTSNCSTCANSTSTCLTCVGMTDLYGQSCVASCPSQTYLINGKCLPCDSSCDQCSGSPTSCTSCPASYYLFDTTCVSACPNNTYYNIDMQTAEITCLLCTFPCATCSYSSLCTTCIDGFYLYDNACESSCPIGTQIVNGSSCELIPPSCAATTDSNANFNASAVSQVVMGTCDPGFVGEASAYCDSTGSWDTNQFNVTCSFTTVVTGGNIVDLTTTYIDSDSVTLSWSMPVNATVNRFVAYISADGVTFSTIFTNGVLKSTAVTATGLTQDTLYYFQVFGASAGNSIDTVGAQITATTTINPPGTLYVSNVTGSSFGVSWPIPSGSLANYFVISLGVSLYGSSNTTRRTELSSATNWTVLATIAATAPGTTMAYLFSGLQPLTSYDVWIQAALEKTDPEPVGSSALVTTTKIVDSSASLPVGAIVGVIAAVILLLLCLLIALICYRRRVANRQKQILEEFGMQLAPLSSLQMGSTIPDNVVVGYDSKGDITKTSTKILSQTDATMINTVLEVALPGFLRLNYATDLRTERKLAQGGVGTIWQAQLLDNQLAVRNGSRVVVLKHVDDRQGALEKDDLEERFHQEVSIMWSLSFHPNIIKLVGYTDQPMAIVTPLYKTDLFRFLHNQEDKSQLASDLLLNLSAGILAGMSAVHSMGVAHRDIKSPNILLAEPPAGGLFPVPVICDFGLSRTEDDSSIKKAVVIRGLSPRYAAPEVFARLHLRSATSTVDDDKRSDMYSIGVTLWEMVARRIPWDRVGVEEIEATVRGGGRLEYLAARPDYASQQLVVTIMDQCLAMSDVRRPTAAACNTRLNDLLLLQSGMAVPPTYSNRLPASLPIPALPPRPAAGTALTNLSSSPESTSSSAGVRLTNISQSSLPPVYQSSSLRNGALPTRPPASPPPLSGRGATPY